MTTAELLDRYLAEFFTLQIATVAGGRPWVCTVYFLADAERNLYWLSLPNRRHSQEIEKQPQVAGAIVVQNIIGRPVIGVQIEGAAVVQAPPLDDATLAQRYADKFQRDQQWVADFVAGRTEHRLYKLTPSAIYLFDEENFPGGQRQQVV